MAGERQEKKNKSRTTLSGELTFFLLTTDLSTDAVPVRESVCRVRQLTHCLTCASIHDSTPVAPFPSSPADPVPFAAPLLMLAAHDDLAAVASRDVGRRECKRKQERERNEQSAFSHRAT